MPHAWELEKGHAVPDGEIPMAGEPQARWRCKNCDGWTASHHTPDPDVYAYYGKSWVIFEVTCDEHVVLDIMCE